MRAYTRGHDSADVLNVRVGIMVPMLAYTHANDHAYMPIRVGMNATMPAYIRGNDRAFACLYVQACLRVCVHTRVSMIMPMCACTHGNHGFYVCIHA